jgi:short-subunit dehydrogenase
MISRSARPSAMEMIMSEKEFALITEASSGLGEALARKLASQGYNLIIVARSKDRLQSLASELGEKHSIQVEVLPADLALEQDLARVANRIRAANAISMLINNAGFGTRGDFAQVDIEKSINMINVHVVASTRLTQAVLPQMIERNRGTIVNISSGVADVPASGRVVYAATKAYLNSFSQSLQAEMEDKDINVRTKAITPGFTNTGCFSTEEFGHQGISDEYLRYAKSPEKVAEDVLASLTREEAIVTADAKTRETHSLMVNEGKPWEDTRKEKADGLLRRWHSLMVNEGKTWEEAARIVFDN